MPEQFADVGDIKICWESFGDSGDPPLLLIMGLGTQMIAWHDDFCADLARRGFHVIRFDNRDIGRSTHVRGRPPTPKQLLLRDKAAARYSLADMADDAAGLLDELGLSPAHIVGASMGGMIAQTLAARRPEYVRSLVSIMSTTGSRRHGQPALKLYPMFLRQRPQDRDAYIEATVRTFRAIGSPGRADLDDLRETAARSYERDHSAAGTGRQLAAILAAGDRTAEVRTIRAPTLVIHGTKDPLVNASGGRATKRAIAGARGLKIEGMGHDLPRWAWPQILDAIAEHCRTADAARGAATPSAA